MPPTLESAWKAYKRGDNDQALKEFQELTSAQSSSPHPLIQKGLFLLHTDKNHEAVESFQQARTIQPLNPAPIFFQALAQELSGDSIGARATIEELKSVCPHHQGIQTLLLLCELRGGDPLPLLSKLGYGPAKADAHRSNGGLKNALLAGLGKGDPDSLAPELSSSDFVLGPILLEIEKRLHAKEIPSLEHHRPILPEDLSKVKPVKRSLVEELRHAGHSFKASFPLHRGKRLLEKAYGMAARDKQAALLQKAILELRKSRFIDRHGFRVSYYLGESYLFLARGETGKPYNRFRLLQAQTSFLESADREGINPYLLFYIAYTQHILGRPKLALKYYKEATMKFEKLPEAHYGAGQCELLLGNLTQAKRLMLRAVNSDLALARERLDLFTTLLHEHGSGYFDTPLPTLPPEPEPVPEVDPTLGPESEKSEPSPESSPPQLQTE